MRHSSPAEREEADMMVGLRLCTPTRQQVCVCVCTHTPGLVVTFVRYSKSLFRGDRRGYITVRSMGGIAISPDFIT